MRWSWPSYKTSNKPLQRGEIATAAILIGIGIMAIGSMIGPKAIEYGTRLFTRAQTGITPAPVGQCLYAQAANGIVPTQWTWTSADTHLVVDGNITPNYFDRAASSGQVVTNTPAGVNLTVKTYTLGSTGLRIYSQTARLLCSSTPPTCTAPVAPTISAPTQGQTIPASPLTIQWNHASTANTRYQVLISSSDGSQTLLDQTVTAPTTSLSYDFTGKGGNSYAISVVAYNSCGTTNLGQAVTVIVASAPTNVTLNVPVSIVNPSADYTAVVRINELNVATYIECARRPATGDFVAQCQGVPGKTYEVRGTGYVGSTNQVASAMISAAFVMPTTGGSDPAAWSRITLPAPATCTAPPTPASITATRTYVTATGADNLNVSWPAVTGAHSYVVSLLTSDPNTTVATGTIVEPSFTATSYQSNLPATYKTQNIWVRIQSRTSDATCTSRSVFSQMLPPPTAPPAAPTCVDTDNGMFPATKGSVTETDATGPHVYADTCSSTGVAEYSCSKDGLGNVSGAALVDLSQHTCLNGTTCVDGACVASAPPACTAPASVGGITPNGAFTATGQPTNITWTAISGISKYAIRIDKNADTWFNTSLGRYPSTCSEKNPEDTCLDNLTTNSFSYTFEPGLKYVIWVHAIPDCDVAGASWSPYDPAKASTVTVSSGAPNCTLPDPPVITAPTENATVTVGTPTTISWTSAYTATTKFRVVVDNPASAAFPDFTQDVSPNTLSLSYTFADPNAAYKVYVGTHNVCGQLATSTRNVQSGPASNVTPDPTQITNTPTPTTPPTQITNTPTPTLTPTPIPMCPGVQHCYNATTNTYFISHCKADTECKSRSGYSCTAFGASVFVNSSTYQIMCTRLTPTP